MNPLAEELNEILRNSLAFELLSDYGKRIYFPKGIISQSNEAKQNAYKYNATIGVATEKGEAMGLNSIFNGFNSYLKKSDVLSYSPTAGELGLRKKWLEQMREKNPALGSKNCSLPIVTSGLTHSINLVAELFLDKGDSVIIPDMYWDNYDLIFAEQREAKQISFELFKDDKLNIEGLEKAIDSVKTEKVALLLNFPNNPTGYTPTVEEANTIAQMIIKKADEGKKLLIFIDDAYFGLFFEENVCHQSLFALLADAHKNILMVKGDAATKEDMVWGFRVGFLTFNNKEMSGQQYEALVQKAMGSIRATISSSSKPAQTILFEAMKNSHYQKEKEEGVAKIKRRYHLMKKTLANYNDNEYLKFLPFNSGYFMTFTCAKDAEKLRLHLLDKYGVGTISIKDKYLRLAFSSIDLEDIEDLVKIVYEGAQEVLGK